MKFHAPDTLDAISVLLEQIEDALTAAEVPFAAIHAATLCIEELVVNILKHGRIEGKKPNIEIALHLEHGRIVIEITDDTNPFDPTTAAVPEHIDTPLEERPIGGLGIHLVKTLTDEMRYRRVGEHNHLRLVKRLEPT